MPHLAQIDLFDLELDADPIGDLRGIEVGFSTKQSVAGKLGSLAGKDWYLVGVEVMDLQTGTHYTFIQEDWLTSKNRRVALQPKGSHKVRVGGRTPPPAAHCFGFLHICLALLWPGP